MTRILVWDHKYGQSYFDASDSASLEASATFILQKLVEDSWVCEPDRPRFSEEEEGYLALTPEEVDGLPAAVKLQVTTARDRLAIRLKAYAEELAEHRELVAVAQGLELPGLPSAWSILQSRDGYEYESYSLATVKKV